MTRGLDASEFLNKAEQRTGLTDWGEIPFRESLDVLCRSAQEECLRGRPAEAFAANIDGILAKRLRLVADRKTYPEIARQQVRRPLFVTGLPRSGTTILHSLLSQDPAHRSPQKWELDDPSPPPRAETYDSDPRIAVAAAAVERIEPEFRAMHQMGAQLPEECIQLQILSFQSLVFWAAHDLPTYSEWLMGEADTLPSFQFHRHYLQHLQAFAPKERWVLKAPSHMFWLDKLLEVYPDAGIVVMHRDPAEVLPSNASMVAFIRNRMGEVDPRAIGADQVRVWGTAVQRAMDFRARTPRPEQFFDTHYSDFIRDPLTVVRAIYQHFDMTLTPEAEAAMRAFMAENRQDKHGKHVYSAEQFGLDKPTLHRAFAGYIDHYGVRTR